MTSFVLVDLGFAGQRIDGGGWKKMKKNCEAVVLLIGRPSGVQFFRGAFTPTKAIYLIDFVGYCILRRSKQCYHGQGSYLISELSAPRLLGTPCPLTPCRLVAGSSSAGLEVTS